jgi:hypothetical protein
MDESTADLLRRLSDARRDLEDKIGELGDQWEEMARTNDAEDGAQLVPDDWRDVNRALTEINVGVEKMMRSVDRLFPDSMQ